MKYWFVLLAALLALSCQRGGDTPPPMRCPLLTDCGTATATDGGIVYTSSATISGFVWAPGNAPGPQVLPGHEIPVFNAIVRLMPERPDPIEQRVYCEQCIEVDGVFASSAHDGSFRIAGIAPGMHWLVVQKGQFRIERQIMLAEGENRELEALLTTLPSIHDPENGNWLPQVAVAAGDWDALEDVLGKMGVGAIDARGAYQYDAVRSSSVDFYYNGGATYPGNVGNLRDLMRSLDKMLNYHIIFIPCAGNTSTSALQDTTVLQNIRDYVAAGGKLYVTDWSGEWHDNVFPAQIELEAGADTPAAAYDPDLDRWNPTLFGSADGDFYDSDDAEAVDEDLNLWLEGQIGPLAEGGQGVFDANEFSIIENWNVIENITPVQVGTDSEGLPIMDQPKTFVIGSRQGTTTKKPLTVTYEPVGCGRVLYSTYHTTDPTHPGLNPQERILLYLIMEIGVCKEGPFLF